MVDSILTYIIAFGVGWISYAVVLVVVFCLFKIGKLSWSLLPEREQDELSMEWELVFLWIAVIIVLICLTVSIGNSILEAFPNLLNILTND